MIEFTKDLEAFVEVLARQIAADKMKLVKDQTGSRLPEDIWSRCIPDARKFLGLTAS
jgi:hypothetical protein